MKYKIIFLLLLIQNIGFSQVSTIVDSLDNPIAMTFVNDEVFVVLQGSLPEEGKIVSFNLTNPTDTYKTHFDSLTYPRAIIEEDSILYIGLRDDIVKVDLRNSIYEFDTLYHEQFLFPRSFEFVEDELIFAQTEALSKIDISNSNQEKEILFFFENNPLSIAKYENSILIAEGKSIHKYDLNTNTIYEIISDLEYNTYSLLVSGNNLYLDQSDLTFGSEEIVVFNLKALEVGSNSYCDNLGNAISLTEHQGEIYFAQQKTVFNGMPEGKIQVIEKELVSSLHNVIKTEIKVFPNPTNSIINIEGGDQLNYEIYNLAGEKVFLESQINHLNISNEPSGIYFLTILDQFGNLRETKKIIKE